MAEAEAPKQTFFEETVISSTPATPLGDCHRSRGNREPGRRFHRREWRQTSQGRKQRPRAARPGYDRHDWDTITKEAKPETTEFDWKPKSGGKIAGRIKSAGNSFTIALKTGDAPDFGAYISRRLDELYEAYRAGRLQAGE